MNDILNAGENINEMQLHHTLNLLTFFVINSAEKED